MVRFCHHVNAPASTQQISIEIQIKINRITQHKHMRENTDFLLKILYNFRLPKSWLSFEFYINIKI